MGKYRCLFFVTALCILASCAKEERFSSDGFGPADQAKGFGHGYQSKVFMVPAPSGDDDTQNLLNTIELAQSQGPGSVVQFQKGTYNIGFIEIMEFNGTIRGAGMNKTIIKPVPELPCLEESEKTWDVALISFIGGNIKMSDLSFDIDDDVIPCEKQWSNILGDMGYDLYILVKFVDRVNDHYIPKDLFVSAQLDNVSFSGGLDDGTGSAGKYNVGAGIWFGHDYTTLPAASDVDRSNGNLTVNNCHFSDLWCGVDLPGLKSGKVIITNNIFKDIGYPLFLFDNTNTKGIISGNSFSGSIFHDLYINDMDYGVFGFYPYTPPVIKTTWKITGNYFNTENFGGSFMNPAGVSIYMLDVRRTTYPEENMAMEFFVNNNTFNLQKDAKGIVGLNNIGAMVVSNKFKGTGAVGISLDGENGICSSSNKILGNNFSMADYETDIYLGPLTKNCLVAGSPMATIVNEGVGNRITGKP